ncbi:MAG: putative O-glycosylation ligase, exosortase A system-associated [Burkholderiales bacterium]|nr:putative O-glycosylation ligase, exosortase A system-associated [Burkholderiales bacterium]OJX08660.1 MAG: putative O-glycosylation ligase, exosortase A system-associated [Burkholderiales bacterium 70-64]
MRDVFLTLVLVGFLPVGLKRPYIGALMFAVISLANPHRFTWGFAYSMPWAVAYAAVTMIGMAFTKERVVGDSIRRYMPMLIYLAWMLVTSIFAFEKQAAMDRWLDVMKVHLMCLVTLCLLTDWRRVRQLVWVAVCCIGFFGLKGGIFTIAEGGDYLVWGPPNSAIQDNNHLAVALVMMLPMMYWLFTQARKPWLKGLIGFSALMTAASIFGSHSRSAFLGIAAVAAFLVLKSKHKLSLGLLAVIVGMLSTSLMPQQYWNRMSTIETYQEDASAMGRINVWNTAINIANDRVTGAGFEYYTPQVFKRYAPNPADIHSSHSIYFQALGEHGWIGLLLFAYIWVYVWLRCRRVIKLADASEEGRAQALLARMIQVSLVGFAVGGAFVNIGNWDMVYYLAVAALGTTRIIDIQVATRNVVQSRSRSIRQPELASQAEASAQAMVSTPGMRSR